jgi:hypothetical protein
VGRQLARVTAVPYGETVSSQLYPGSQNGLNCLHSMIEHSEAVLGLNERQRRRTIWRLDGGFGSDASINWVLARQCQLVVKGYSGLRAKYIVAQIPAAAWESLRENRWLAVVPSDLAIRYARTTQPLALYWIPPSQKPKCALLIHTLLDRTPREVTAFYDQRGGMEVEIQQDKVGLQLVERRKQRWDAQAAWVTLTDLAHDLLRWSHDWMWCDSRFASYGCLRLVQDVLGVPGRLEFGGPKGDKLQKVALLRTHPFAQELVPCLERLFKELKP